jgi:hypothetical protein
MLTLFANSHLPSSAGNANPCSRPSVLKVAVVAAAAELLRLADESVDGAALLNGSDKESLTAGVAPGEPAAKRLPPAPTVVQTAGPGGGSQDGAVLHF